MSVQLELQAHYREVRTRLWRPAVKHEKPASKPVLRLVKANAVIRYQHPIGPIVPDAVCLTLEHFGKPGSGSYARKVRAEIAEKFGLAIEEIMGEQRSKKIVEARHEIFWRLKKETKWSLPQIGRFMGRDHTTVLHGLRRYAKRHGQDNGNQAQAD